MEPRDWLGELKDQDDESAHQRLAHLVDQHIPNGELTRALLERLPPLDAAAHGRILVAYEQRVEPRTPIRLWIGVGTLVAAAAALVLVLVGQDGPRVLDGEGQVALSADVQLTWHGTGTAEERGGVTEVQWSHGSLGVAITPDRGIDLVVATPEARARAVGTAFTVVRDALGTTVDVTEGRVAVVCTDGWTGELSQAAHVCLPTAAGQLLARVDRLRELGAPSAEVLQTIERGLEAGAGRPVMEGELLFRRAAIELEEERFDDARATAEAYRGTGASARLTELAELLGEGE